MGTLRGRTVNFSGKMPSTRSIPAFLWDFSNNPFTTSWTMPSPPTTTTLKRDSQHVKMMHSNRKMLPLSPRLILIFLRGLRRAFKGLQIRDVTKISSCQENTKSTRGIRQLGISFGSIFLLSSYERSWGHIIEAREMGWGLYLRGIVTRTGKALPNKLLIAAILNKIPFKPDQNK